MSDKCNGWQNYATWTVNLFITNESNECIREATQAAVRDMRGDHLKDFVEEYFCVNYATGEPYGNLFIQQMLSAAMSEVNWRELRDHFVADNEDDEDDEDDEDNEDNEDDE